VAFKVFRNTSLLGASGVKQLVTELQAGRRLRHANLVRLFGYVKLETHGLALVLELVAGPVPGGLRGVLDSRDVCASIPWARRVRWLGGIAAGMAELHTQSVVHRDLKAGNVLLSSADLSAAVPKVADFGIAVTIDTMRSTLSGGGGGGMAGTLAWKAPETFRRQGDTASDVFSFGVVIFEVVSRALPWPDKTAAQVQHIASKDFEFNQGMLDSFGITEHQQRQLWDQQNPLAGRRPDLTAVEAGCPPELLALLQRCWADHLADRLSFEECVWELGQIRPRRETFADSHFKRAYEQSGFDEVTMATEVLAAVSRFVRHYCTAYNLTSDADRALSVSFLRELQRETATHAAVDAHGVAGPTAELLWTSAKIFDGVAPAHRKELCSLINAALRDDKPELAAATAGIARALNATLCVVRGQTPAALRFPAGGTTYRGGQFSDEHRGFFEAGRQYRVPGFLATSFSERVAEEFAQGHPPRPPPPGQSRIIWVVHVDPAGAGDEARRCKHVNFVDNSHIVDAAGQPREAEFLFAPYSVFTVRSVAWDANGGTHRIELDAATDNTAVAAVAGSERWATPAASEDLPLAPWY
jgi:serine/threonine protein kinase